MILKIKKEIENENHFQKELRQKKEDAFCPLEKFVFLGVQTPIQGVSMAVLQGCLDKDNIAMGDTLVSVECI